MKTNKYILAIIIICFILSGCNHEESKNQKTEKEVVSIQSTSEQDYEVNVDSNKIITPFSYNEEIYKGLYLKMKIEEVVDILGPPKEKSKLNCEIRGEITVVEYDGVYLEFDEKIDGILTYIELNNIGQTVIRNIKIGDGVKILNNMFYEEIIELSKDKNDNYELSKAQISYQENCDEYTVTFHDKEYPIVAIKFVIKDNILIKAIAMVQVV